MKRALLLLLWAGPIFAQLQVQVALSGALTPAGNAISLANTAVGAPSETQFRATNTGASNIPLQTLTVNGAAYALSTPFQPVTLVPGGTYDFKVRFAPVAPGSYSAVLTVNLFTTLLRSTAVVAPTLSLGADAVPDTGLRFATTGTTPVTQTLTLYNYTDQPLTVPIPILSGTGFRLLNGFTALLALAPRENFELQIQFVPPAEGTYTAALGLSVYRVALTGVSTRARVPTPNIVIDSAPIENSQQIRLRVQFGTPSPIDGSGVLKVIFVAANQDPAVQFTNGSDQIPFTVAAGSTEAVFAFGTSATLQTGTTAGVLQLVATTESGDDRRSWTLAPAPLVIDSASATRDGSTLSVTLAGFDNTRTAGSLNFRFYDRAGNPIGNVITTALTEEFKVYFQQSTLGGIFRLRAAFPVTGDATMVGSVRVEIANVVGRTDVARLTFP